MSADDHLLVGILGAGDLHDDVVHLLLLVSDVQVEACLRRPGADVVGEGQSTLEVLGSLRAAELAQERLGLAVGQRRGGNPRQVLGVRGREPRGARDRGLARRERVAGVLEQILDAASLDALGVAPLPVGIDGPLDEPVLLGIRVDDQAAGSMLLGHASLHATKALSVPGQNDLSLNVDPELSQSLVVVRQAVVDVHHLPADVPGG